jgi:hypothetical protein
VSGLRGVCIIMITNFSRVWRQNCAEKTGPSLSDQHFFSGSNQLASERLDSTN